jgi:hypothetical protein
MTDDYSLFRDVDEKQFLDVKEMLYNFDLERPMWHLQNVNGDYLPVQLDRKMNVLQPLYAPSEQKDISNEE